MARCAAFVFVLLSAASAAAQVRDPYLTWRTIETPRFAVHYHEPLGVMARKVAVAAEQAHARLAPILKHTPTTRTHIVLSDNTDDANGLASVLPYNTMRLYASAPEDLSALDDYDDWMVTLVTHEYTHILHLDTIAGIPAVLNAVLGKTFSTNNNQPRWFIEGLAVDEESLQTSAGRERSAVFDMYMRMDALEGRLLRLDQVSNSVDRWPWGNVPYIYGSRFMRFIAETHGREALTAISHDYGEDLIPYALNRTAKRATGKTYVELYADFRAELEEKSRALVARIEREGRVEGRRLTTEGEYARSPRFLPDGRIAYWSSDGNTFSEIRAVPWSGHGHDRLVRANGPGSLGVRSDGTLVFSGANAHRDLYFFNDLHLYSERDDRTTRLSDGLRAREPDVSPDDSRVAFTVNGAGTTHLAVAPLNEPSQRRLLVRSPRFGQVYTPRWSPDGTRIAFSAWEKGGFRDIRIVDVRTGAVTDVTRDRAMDTGPAWSPDGRTLYFSSDRSGVFNIYAFELGSRVLRRVTHVVAGAFQPDVSRDGKRLTYLGYSSRGFDVFALDLDPATFRAAEPYESNRPAPSYVDDAEGEALQSDAYSPLDTLGPRNYSLDYTTDAFGNALSIRTSGFDAVGYHAWAARLGVGLERGNIDAEASWTYRRLPAPVTFAAFHALAPRQDLYVEGHSREWIRRAYGGEISTRYSLPLAFEAHSLSLGYALTAVDKAEPFGGILDPNDPGPVLPRLGLLTRLRAGWSYSNVVQTRYDVSPSWGRAFFVSTSMSHPYIGSDFESLSLQWGTTQFFENPWIEHHVLSFRYAGAYGTGPRTSRPYFAVGGFPDTSILDGLVDGIVLGGVALRGYAPSSRVGTQYHLLQTEYRFLLWRPQWGPGLAPFFLNRLWGSAFVDYGNAFSGDFTLSGFRTGVGGELLTDFTIGYTQTFTLRIGVAQGLDEGGVTQVYVNLGNPF